MAGIYIPGLIALIVFYLLILLVGIVVAWFKTRKESSGDHGTDTVIVASRDIGLFVGVFTMTATWVGGGYINGTAEYVYLYGIVWAQAPVGYSISLVIGGLFFAGPMREKRYLTMLDPFQQKYGNRVGGLLYLPALCGELFWSAAILNALGSSVAVILEIDFEIAVVASACIAVFYTFFGGLYSVAYTDVVQLFCVAFGLTLCVPFAWYNANVDMTAGISPDNSTGVTQWIGHIGSSQTWTYIDGFLLLICGGVPYQAYFQRVLSVSTVWKAKVLSYCGGLGCLIMVIPSILIGIIAQSSPVVNCMIYLIAFTVVSTSECKSDRVLPYVLRYLTPVVVSFFGLGAVSAAVMSSSDSSMLSASSMFAHNIYKMIFRPKASDKEIVWVLRVSIVCCGAIATVIGLTVKRFFIGLLLRLLGGEKDLGLPAAIEYGDFPFKTVATIVNFAVTLIVSLLALGAFTKRKIFPMKYDVFNAFVEDDSLHFGRTKVWHVPKETVEMNKVQGVSEGYGNMAFSEK